MHTYRSPVTFNLNYIARTARDVKEQINGDTQPLRELLGPATENFQKPDFGTPAYMLAHRCGWISDEEEQAERAAYERRRNTSLQRCHYYSLYECPRKPVRRKPGPTSPELAARIEDDPNLTDGARRWGRGTGRSRSSRALIRVKMATFAPIPKASERMATAVKPGFLRRARTE